MSGLAWGTLPSPVGELSVAASAEGVARVCFGPPAAPPGGRPPGKAPAGSARAGELAAEAARQLAEYFRGERRVFDVPVDWPARPPGRRAVLQALWQTVGFGETITYGALAARAGLARPAAAGGGRDIPARVVGQIMGANPVPLIVPCHRVVAGQGLGGYSGGAGVEVKRWLLVFEGAMPATLDWDPAGLG